MRHYVKVAVEQGETPRGARLISVLGCTTFPCRTKTRFLVRTLITTMFPGEQRNIQSGRFWADKKVVRNAKRRCSADFETV